MDYKISAEEKRITIFLSGRFDCSTGEIFQKIQSELLETNPQELFFLAIDFSEVSYIDSSAIGMLLSLRAKTSQKYGVKISLINAHDLVKKVIETMGLRRIFNVS